MGLSVCRGPVGEAGEEVHLQGTMTDSEGGLQEWSVSLFWALLGESQRWGSELLSWVCGKIWGGGLMRWAFLSVGTLLGSLVRCSSARELRKFWRWTSLSMGGPFTG